VDPDPEFSRAALPNSLSIREPMPRTGGNRPSSESTAIPVGCNINPEPIGRGASKRSNSVT
jgi:hypothetical protein